DSACGADRLEHLARSTAPGATGRTLCFAGVTAISATLRLVLEALFRIKLLLSDREREPDTAVLTADRLVFHQNLRDRSTQRLPTCYVMRKALRSRPDRRPAV